MKSNGVLNVGIVGCGFVAEHWHIPPLARMKDVTIAALCDKDEELAKRVAAKFGVKRYYTELSQMLQAEKLDIVDICAPPQTHAPLCIAAMEAGCSVLVEKPIALNCEQADAITEAAEKNGVKLCVCHNKLFQSMIVRAKHRIEEGRIGDLTGVDLRDSWAGDNAELLARDHWCHKLPPGPFGEMLPHPVYIHAVVFQVFGLSDRLADDMDLVPPIRECGREAMVDSGDSAPGGIRRVLPAEQRDLHSPASSPR